jgi:hypothetical protein
MKNGSISLSVGFLVTDAAERADGVKELCEVDLFEISLRPTPASRDMRILSMKSMGTDDLPDPDTLRRWARAQAARRSRRAVLGRAGRGPEAAREKRGSSSAK